MGMDDLLAEIRILEKKVYDLRVESEDYKCPKLLHVEAQIEAGETALAELYANKDSLAEHRSKEHDAIQEKLGVTA